MLKEGGKLSLLTMVSRVLGLVREMTKASFIGTGFLAEAFTVAFTIPNLMRRLFAENSMTVAFIPTFTAYLEEKDEAKTRKFLSATFTVLVFSVLATVALGIALTPWIVSFFQSEPVETAFLTRMMFPFLALVSIAALFQGILNSIGVFTPSAMGPIVFNLSFIVVPSLIGAWTGNPARAMAVGVLVGGLLQALCQLPAVLKAGFRFGFIGLGAAFRDPGLRKVLALLAPTLLGMAAYQLNDVVCTAVATGVKAAASIQYSMRLLELVLGIFAVSAGTVLLPRLSAAAQRRDWVSYSDSLGSVMRAMILVTLPVALFSMIESRDLVTVVYMRGEFGEASVAATSSVLFFHMLGLVFIALNRVISPAFYAVSDAKTPTWAGVASFAVNIVAALVFARLWAGPGIALALSISSAMNTLILLLALRRSTIEGTRKALANAASYFLKILLLSALAALALYLLKPLFSILLSPIPSAFLRSGLSLLLATLLYGGIGIGLLGLIKDDTALSLVASILRRRK